MYCSSCGTYNDDNNFRCIQCGTMLQHGAAPMAAGGAGAYGSQQAWSEPNKADTALIFGVLGWVVCGLLAIPGFLMARDEIAAIEDGRRNPSKLSSAKAAYWLALVLLAFLALGIFIFAGAMVFVVAAG